MAIYFLKRESEIPSYTLLRLDKVSLDETILRMTEGGKKTGDLIALIDFAIIRSTIPETQEVGFIINPRKAFQEVSHYQSCNRK